MTRAQRCRYGWHFPELGKIVADHFNYARIVILAKDKMNINEELQPQIQDIVDDPDIAEQVCALPLHPLPTRSLLACLLLSASNTVHVTVACARGLVTLP